jgi:hypothetical protein
MNKAFLLLQSGLGGITLLSASYTYYLIDLSDSMSFGLSVFAAIKLVQSMDDRWSRAKPGFRKSLLSQVKGKLLVLGFLEDRVTSTQTKALQTSLEQVVGLPNVVRVDDLFGGESFVKSQCSKFNALLVNVMEDHSEAIRVLIESPEYKTVDVSTHDMVNLWDPESKSFTAEAAPILLASAVRLLQDDWATSA